MSTYTKPGPGLRSYGPGKFSTIVDSYLYDIMMNGDLVEDEILNEGYSESLTLMIFDDDFVDYMGEAANDVEDTLTQREIDFLDAQQGAIVHERSDGIVEVHWYEDLGTSLKSSALMAAWAEDLKTWERLEDD